MDAGVIIFIWMLPCIFVCFLINKMFVLFALR